MFTLDQLTAALPTLDEAFRTIDGFDSLTIKWVCPTHVYYTDGEARGAIANLQIGRKNPKHVPGKIDLSNHKVQHCSMYIFPDGKIMSHFMKWSPTYTNTSEYVKCVGVWMTALGGV
jgi:hypothetical protein